MKSQKEKIIDVQNIYTEPKIQNLIQAHYIDKGDKRIDCIIVLCDQEALVYAFKDIYSYFFLFKHNFKESVSNLMKIKTEFFMNTSFCILAQNRLLQFYQLTQKGLILLIEICVNDGPENLKKILYNDIQNIVLVQNFQNDSYHIVISINEKNHIKILNQIIYKNEAQVDNIFELGENGFCIFENNQLMSIQILQFKTYSYDYSNVLRNYQINNILLDKSFILQSIFDVKIIKEFIIIMSNLSIQIYDSQTMRKKQNIILGYASMVSLFSIKKLDNKHIIFIKQLNQNNNNKDSQIQIQNNENQVKVFLFHQKDNNKASDWIIKFIDFINCDGLINQIKDDTFICTGRNMSSTFMSLGKKEQVYKCMQNLFIKNIGQIQQMEQLGELLVLREGNKNSIHIFRNSLQMKQLYQINAQIKNIQNFIIIIKYHQDSDLIYLHNHQKIVRIIFNNLTGIIQQNEYKHNNIIEQIILLQNNTLILIEQNKISLLCFDNEIKEHILFQTQQSIIQCIKYDNFLYIQIGHDKIQKIQLEKELTQKMQSHQFQNQINTFKIYKNNIFVNFFATDIIIQLNDDFNQLSQINTQNQIISDFTIIDNLAIIGHFDGCLRVVDVNSLNVIFKQFVTQKKITFNYSLVNNCLILKSYGCYYIFDLNNFIIEKVNFLSEAPDTKIYNYENHFVQLQNNNLIFYELQKQSQKQYSISEFVQNKEKQIIQQLCFNNSLYLLINDENGQSYIQEQNSLLDGMSTKRSFHIGRYKSHTFQIMSEKDFLLFFIGCEYQKKQQLLYLSINAQGDTSMIKTIDIENCITKMLADDNYLFLCIEHISFQIYKIRHNEEKGIVFSLVQSNYNYSSLITSISFQKKTLALISNNHLVQFLVLVPNIGKYITLFRKYAKNTLIYASVFEINHQTFFLFYYHNGTIKLAVNSSFQNFHEYGTMKTIKKCKFPIKLIFVSEDGQFIQDKDHQILKFNIDYQNMSFISEYNENNMLQNTTNHENQITSFINIEKTLLINSEQ